MKLSVLAAVIASLPVYAQGIAQGFPGDVGIESHKDVVLVEMFEGNAPSDVFKRWTNVSNGEGMMLDADVPQGSGGGRSLKMTARGGANTGGHLFKLLSPGIDDQAYLRYYVKYSSVGAYHHTGGWLGGFNPPTAGPQGYAGIKPAGNDRFSIACEPQEKALNYYIYWKDMRAQGNSYYGNDFFSDPRPPVRFDQWMCIEIMMKLNTPVTATNGEMALWIDGTQVSRLGTGFPNGTWQGPDFHPGGGQPFPGFQWRSDAKLNINWLWLLYYVTQNPKGVDGNMKFDHVVLARSYIGPMRPVSSKAPDAVPDKAKPATANPNSPFSKDFKSTK